MSGSAEHTPLWPAVDNRQESGAGLWGVSGNPDVAGGSNGLWGAAGNAASRQPGYMAPGVLPIYIDPYTGQTGSTPPDMGRHLPGAGSPLAPSSAPTAVIDRASEADQRLGGLTMVVGGINSGARRAVRSLTTRATRARPYRARAGYFPCHSRIRLFRHQKS